MQRTAAPAPRYRVPVARPVDEIRTRVLKGLNSLHERYRDLDEGRLASYIPELANADPAAFAICVVDIRGNAYHVGDHDRQFTIQSVSKPFAHALALRDRGRDYVMQRVGVEPTGDAFDSIIRLDASNRPHNPMNNAGAIAVTGMIGQGEPAHRLEQILGLYSRALGKRPSVDMTVFTSEKIHGHRNRAIAHLMTNFGLLDRPVDEILELYFQQCSILVDARDLAVLAATLANAGVSPITGDRVVEEPYVRDVLTVMDTCGMYNYAGEWAYAVGLPAKSGVSGGIIAILPGELGIGVYSPNVDERGNSVRGIRVCEDLSRNAGMHLLEPRRAPGAVLERFDNLANPLPPLPDTSHPGGDATVHKRDNERR